MKNFNSTVMVLGAISIIELIVLHQLEGSLILWIGYGIFRGIRWLIKEGVN